MYYQTYKVAIFDLVECNTVTPEQGLKQLLRAVTAGVTIVNGIGKYRSSCKQNRHEDGNVVQSYATMNAKLTPSLVPRAVLSRGAAAAAAANTASVTPKLIPLEPP
jgi:hypothetical protein